MTNEATPDRPPPAKMLSVVGIGASAGGVKALQTFFEALPDGLGAAFVVIIHLAPETRSELASILATKTRMSVVQVHDPVRLEPDHVYIIPPDRYLEIVDNHVAAREFTDRRSQRAPIDMFFRSLARQHGDGFAIILTGAGSDGAIGLRAIKEAGGIILIQDPTEAEYGSMPRSAIATGFADFVLPLQALVKRLVELIERKRDGVEPDHLRDADEEYIPRILAHIRARTGHDFSQYKRSTILRRITRRAQLTRREQISDYFTYLRDNVEEAQSLFNDLLISVTTFFRDPKAFAALAEQVIPQLFDKKDADGALRVWVPGCATGEEAYSIAILLLEESARRDVRPHLQVFASDLDLSALGMAREGLYPLAIQADVSEERLRRFFTREGDHYRAKQDLREVVLFATHSLLKDPPFCRLDLISCRNLLIYLDREMQQQVCRVFHYALNLYGYLFLGTSETAETPSGLFRVVDREAHIYVSTGRQSDKSLPFPQAFVAGDLSALRRIPARPLQESETTLHRLALERDAPPSILVDETHRAIHLSETAGRYLQPSGGPVTSDVVELVRPELRSDLRAALHRAFDKGELTLSLPILIRFNGLPHRVYVQVRPVPQEADAGVRQVLVLFIEGEAIEAQQEPLSRQLQDQPATAATVRQLTEELQQTRAQLRATREEAEATNEELRAANEELQSINEEYRSTSEELETSKEELQSINEELQTVNNELKAKLEGVSRAHSDLQNLMAASEFGTLFLDSSGRIKWFTPKITNLFNVTQIDEGRSIFDFTNQLDYSGLSEDLHDVIDNLTFIEREVHSRTGSWYLLRLRPYRTLDNRIDGVVATFVDITERRKVEQALRLSEQRLGQKMRLMELSSEPIFVWNFDDGIVEWNHGCERVYKYDCADVLGRQPAELLKTAIPGSTVEALKQQLLDVGSWSGEMIHTTREGRPLTVEARIELFPMDGRKLVLETARDVSERKTWERRRQLLLNELTHRVKNTLAVVQSMAHQTLRTSRTGDEFVDRFDGRLAALASAHKLLVASEWQGAELGALARAQLEAYSSGEGAQLRIDGEPVILPAQLATPFGLVLHELATNAAKHGALSTPQGTVTLRWNLDIRDSGKVLSVEWREAGGPLVEPPTRSGFGSRLIQRGLPGALVKHEFRPEGVFCSIDLPLSEPGPCVPGTDD